MKTRSLISLIALALIVALPAMAAAPDGGAIYKTKCASCHGADGSGQTPAGKAMKVRDLRSDEIQKMTDLQLTDVIAGGKGKMQGFGKTLSSADIQAVIAHIRTLKKK